MLTLFENPHTNALRHFSGCHSSTAAGWGLTSDPLRGQFQELEGLLFEQEDMQASGLKQEVFLYCFVAVCVNVCVINVKNI